ncbi:MAG: O-antigen ligase family protein [Peptococcaceae bacterium]|nr:O-antigen ligase family protein [Peptococcaceae bacterium]
MFWNIGITRENNRKLLVLIGVMLSAMLLPSFAVNWHLPNIRLDDALLFGIYALNILLYLAGGRRLASDATSALQKQEQALKSIRKIFLVFTAAIIVSNIYGVLILKGTFNLRDVMEFVTLAKYYLVITLAIALELGPNEYTKLKRTFLVGFAVVLLIVWAQNLNIGDFNHILAPFFDPAHWDTLIYGNPARVLAAFDNPNVTGTFALMVLAIVTTRFYFSRDTVKNAILPVILLSLIIKLIFLTISRTALMGTGIMLTFLSLWALFKLRWDKQILVKVGVLFLITLALFFTSPRSFTSRMNEGVHFDTSTSAQGHVKRWGSALAMIEHSPVFGWGTQKSNMTTLVDDEYELITRRYGIVGLAIYLWLFINPFIIALKRGRSFTKSDWSGVIEPRTMFAIAYTGATIAVLLYNITGGTFYNLQLMTLFGIFMGFVYNLKRDAG